MGRKTDKDISGVQSRSLEQARPAVRNRASGNQPVLCEPLPPPEDIPGADLTIPLKSLPRLTAQLETLDLGLLRILTLQRPSSYTHASVLFSTHTPR